MSTMLSDEYIIENVTQYSENDITKMYNEYINSNGGDALLLKKGDPIAYEVGFHDYKGENFQEINGMYYSNDDIEQEEINDDISNITSELIDIVSLGDIIKIFNFDTDKKNGYFDFKEDSFYCDVCGGTHCHCASSMNDEIWSDLFEVLKENQDLYLQIKNSGFIEELNDTKLKKLIKNYFNKSDKI